jgi:hypothetical protein
LAQKKTGKTAKKSPIYLHSNGQWCKTIRGRKVYFGPDEKKALDRYEREGVHLHAGRPIPQPIDETDPTLCELANLSLADVEKRVERGELGKRSYRDYVSTLKNLAQCMGRDSYSSQWSPLDYATIKEWLARPVQRTAGTRGGIKGPKVERRSAVTVSYDQARIKAFLNWCRQMEYLRGWIEYFALEQRKSLFDTLDKLSNATKNQPVSQRWLVWLQLVMRNIGWRSPASFF